MTAMPAVGVAPDMFLLPGELIVSSRPISVRTILGSCIAVCLYDPAAHVGGVNHFLLPVPGPTDQKVPRYGSIAMQLLLDKMFRAGCIKQRLQARVVGGGCPIRSAGPMNIGKLNRDLAVEFLQKEDIRIVQESTGGDHGRKILFETSTGHLNVQRVQGMNRPAATGG